MLRQLWIETRQKRQEHAKKKNLATQNNHMQINHAKQTKHAKNHAIENTKESSKSKTMQNTCKEITWQAKFSNQIKTNQH